MSNVITTVDKLSEAITKELKNYNEVVVKGTKEKAKESMNKLVQKTKETAPERSGKYKKAITSRTVFENSLGAEYEWYVKAPYYRLSHLLENGHVTKDGERTKAFKFIQQASDPIIEDYIKAVEEVCKNG